MYVFTADHDGTVFEWKEPTAWASERLYPFGEEYDDNNVLDERENWWDIYSCKPVRLNGKFGAPFFTQRYTTVYVRIFLHSSFSTQQNVSHGTCQAILI